MTLPAYTSNKFDTRCKRNLVHLQRIRYINDRRQNYTWRNIFDTALRKAIYSHDWNHVAFLLKKVPIWEHHHMDMPLYVRVSNKFGFYFVLYKNSNVSWQMKKLL